MKQSTITAKKSKVRKRPTLFDFDVSSESSGNETSDSEISADVSSLASTPQTHDQKQAAPLTMVDLTCNEDNISDQSKSLSNNHTASLSPLPLTSLPSSSLPSVLPSSSQSLSNLSLSTQQLDFQ